MAGSELNDGSGKISDSDSSTWDLRNAVREFERRHIAAVLTSVAGDKMKAARKLGIGLSSLYRKLDELGMAKDEQTQASPSCDD